MKNITALLLVLSLSLASSTAFSDHHKQTDFKTKELLPGFTLLQGKGGNVLLNKGADGLLVIDDDYADMSDKLKKTIDQYGGLSDLKYVINTHWHGDHTGGNATLGKGAAIVAHDNVRERLGSKQEIPFFKMVSEPQPDVALPDITYPDTMNLYFNNDKVTLQHYAKGHTDGDTVVFFEKANLVHMGDHMFNPFFPFVDFGSGGNVISYRDNVGQVLEKIDDKTIVIPGHGPVTDKAGLTAFYQMLNGTISEVKAMKSERISLEQAKKRGLSKQWEVWNIGFVKEDKWIEFIYQSLPASGIN